MTISGSQERTGFEGVSAGLQNWARQREGCQQSTYV